MSDVGGRGQTEARAETAGVAEECRGGAADRGPEHYLCVDCGEVFGANVRHCPTCEHHYADDECGNCHGSIRRVRRAVRITSRAAKTLLDRCVAWGRP